MNLWYESCLECNGEGRIWADTGCECCSGYDECSACEGLGLILDHWKEYENLIEVVCTKCKHWHAYGTAHLKTNPIELKCIYCGYINKK